ncbi:MAG: RnfABCDGE type electron transport complex subunit D [Clostridia bacterium]|nr:RnfABCDGE type electron transport complex subunit D [Clostridia bacterium]
MTEERTKKAHLLMGSTAPHTRSPKSTHIIMLDVIIALIPLLIWACYVFGLRVLSVSAVSVLSCVLFELLFDLITKKPLTIGDLSAVITGLLLAYALPHTVPLWMPVAGAFISIVIVKMLFGGLGKNLVNPALAGKACMMFCFSSAMTVPSVLVKLGAFEKYIPVEGAWGTTPLSSILTPPSEGTMALSFESVLDQFLGYETGTIGEVSALLILVGFVYRLVRKVITWHIPLSFMATVALITFALPDNGFERFDFMYMLTHHFSGGLMQGAVFMATDYVTCPITAKGRVVFGIGCGLLTVLIRYFGERDGVALAILAMNLLVYFIDKITVPRPLGTSRKPLFARLIKKAEQEHP